MTDSESTAVSSTADDWFARYRRAVLELRPFDFRMGFFVAYFRSFAVPESASILVASGEIPDRSFKRTADTAIIVYEIIWGGFDSERGRAALDILNRAHQHVSAPNEDFLYVLLSLLIVPTRYIDAHGATPLTMAERTASLRFYQELGRRMKLPDVPRSYDDAVRFYDDFEQRRVHSTADVRLLLNSTVRVFGARMPAPLRPLARPIISALIEDPRMLDALGLAPSPRVLSRMVFGFVALRRRFPETKRSSFSPGQRLPGVYPRGYQMRDVGPAGIAGSVGPAAPPTPPL